MLTACGDSARDRLAADAAAARSKPALGRVDSKLTDACDDPADLPERALSAAEVERYWAQDRSALRFCKAKHGGVLRVFLARERIFTGGGR